ncbi:hypothetical protein D3C85_1404150 [compost metagenome]
MLNSELIRHHRDELGVGWLRFRDINRISENKGNAVDVAARPSDFNRVTNRTFNAARRRFVLFSDGWVECLRDRAKDFDVVVHHRNGFAQILISFNMRRYADFMYDRCDIRIQILSFGHGDHIGFEQGGR